MKNAIMLVSGGLDSVVTAHYLRKKLNYNKIRILFFNYGQKTLKQERKFSRKCALGINAEFMEIELKWLKNISNSLINKKGKVKRLKKEDLKDTIKESKKWYVPCRNTIFLSYALAYAESLYLKDKKICNIAAGFKCEGKDSYQDATKEFVKEMNNLSKISCNKPFRVISPLIELDKNEIVLLGKKLKVDFRDTYSCYIGTKRHCGYCLACKLRQAGFYWSNIEDPTRYQ